MTELEMIKRQRRLVKLRERSSGAVVDAVLLAARDRPPGDLWGLLVRMLASDAESLSKQMCDRWQIEHDAEYWRPGARKASACLAAHAAALDDDRRRMMAFEMLIRSKRLVEWNGEYSTVLREACGAFGVDIEAIEREVTAKPKARKTPAKGKAA